MEGNQHLAMKIVAKNDKDAQKVRQEGYLLSQLNHPNIIKLLKTHEN
jgi:hypothetical protein